MNKKVVKLAVYIALSLILVSGLFVTADYFALFAEKQDVRIDFSEVRFRTVNADTGGLIMNVGVRCYQKNNMNACTRKDSHRVGIVSVHIPVRRVIKKTILFQKDAGIARTVDPEINIMLLHQNYDNPTKTLLMEDIYANKLTEYVIEMPPVAWEEEEVSNE